MMKVNVKVGNDVYEVEIQDLNARPVLATINGETFEVYPEEGMPVSSAPVPTTVQPTAAAVPAKTAAPSSAPAQETSGDQTVKTVKAPIPGVILSVAVKAGSSVSVGQELCVLEAMKMKNAIRATRAGTIEEILVSNGDTVSHGQALMTFQD